MLSAGGMKRNKHPMSIFVSKKSIHLGLGPEGFEPSTNGLLVPSSNPKLLYTKDLQADVEPKMRITSH